MADPKNTGTKSADPKASGDKGGGKTAKPGSTASSQGGGKGGAR